ncbi:MAG: hypothetical protein HZB19_12365 [Chloroflexi bacterium]|nr:hypothetical protein [Chloroflexota bacterium]
MKRKGTLLVILLFTVASCGVLPEIPTDISFPATEISIPSTDTPAPLSATDTPIVVESPSPTPGLPPLFTDTPLPVPAAKWWDVYFTDPLTINNPENPAGSIEEKLIALIGAAQTSIHIASFEFNLPRVAQALIEAHNRGVDVRWVTDDENGLEIDGEPNRGQFAVLTGAGIGVKNDAGRSALMHNKFWIFDKQTVWTGSTNITVNGIYKQNNNVIVIRSPEIAYIYEREWEELWSAQLGRRAPSTISSQWAILDGTAVQVLFSAEDHAVSNLIALVNDAQTSIRFLAFSFTDYPLAQAMIGRAAAGVDVQGVYETFGSNSPRSELKTFYCANVPVRQDGNSSFLHDKIIIIDDSIVVTGSLNFSSSADEDNEENVVILDNAEIAALYLQEYEKLWNEAHDLVPADFPCQ